MKSQLYFVGAQVTQEGFKTLNIPMVIEKETPKQYTIGDNPVNRRAVGKGETDIVKEAFPFHEGVFFYAFCEYAYTESMLQKCVERVINRVNDLLAKSEKMAFWLYQAGHNTSRYN